MPPAPGLLIIVLRKSNKCAIIYLEEALVSVCFTGVCPRARRNDSLGHEEGPAKLLLGWHWAGGNGRAAPQAPQAGSTGTFGVLRLSRATRGAGAAPIPAAQALLVDGHGVLGAEGCSLSHLHIPVPGGVSSPLRSLLLPILPCSALPLLSPRRAPKGALGMLCELQLK